MRHIPILLAILLATVTPASAQVTIDLRALDALPATGPAAAASPHRPAAVRHARPAAAARPAVPAKMAARPAAPVVASAPPAMTPASATPSLPKAAEAAAATMADRTTGAQSAAPAPEAAMAKQAAPRAAAVASAAAAPPRIPTMAAAPPPIAQLSPLTPPSGAQGAPPPAPLVVADAATKTAVTRSALRVTFDPGKADLSPDGAAAIKQLVASAPGGAATFNVVAYAAATPADPSTARRLSLSRALAVRSALMADGVDSSHIYVRAMGSNVPSGPADRVDVTLLGGND